MIDLAAATFLDSTAMRTLVTSIAPLREDAAAAVVLAGVQGIVERALTISGIGQMFTVFDTRSAAVDCLADAAGRCGTAGAPSGAAPAPQPSGKGLRRAAAELTSFGAPLGAPARRRAGAGRHAAGRSGFGLVATFCPVTRPL